MRQSDHHSASSLPDFPVTDAEMSDGDEAEELGEMGEFVERGDDASAGERLQPLLRTLVRDDAYNRWFRDSRLTLEEDGSWFLEVPSDTHCLWIETNFMPELHQALGEVLEPSAVAHVRLRVAQARPVTEVRAVGREPETATAAAARKSPEKPGQLDRRIRGARLNPSNTFDRFVVGGSNEFAYAACKAIATGKATNYNPLFLHGDSGMGKTHLMQALGHAILASRPKAKVLYLTCERFTNEFIDSLQKGTIERFRSNYRKADVLMVDDVQFLGGKEKSGDEFFHTFNALLDIQAQIVLTSDRPACEIQTLEPRLVSRFESGLTVDLQPPSLEMRIAILQKKMEEWQVRIPFDILTFIAERVKSNIRRLEGALVRVATYLSLGKGEINEQRVELLLKDVIREEATRKVSIDSIQRVVAEYFDLRVSDLTGRKRPKHIAHARQVAMFLSRKHTQNSLVEIGDAFGRDHGTIIHACKKVTSLVDTEPTTRQTLELIESRLSR
ncbi:MAG: chromosomal replication initiator protein DnaA [Verrucomicrobiota bacterium JB023]|nr:chromosomal replication initiator protein DnaA [Verrucomicrobiota bacterium JB023]